MDIAARIAGISLFEGLPPRQLQEVASIARERRYEKGDVVFLEGDEGTGFYVVVKGRVRVYKISPDGKEQILHLFEAGECFGEVSVFTGKDYPANASADLPATLFFFPRNEFVGLIRKEPSLALNMLAVLSMRLRRFAALIESLSLKEVPGRLAAYIIYLSEREKGSDTIKLDISKGQLAALLGTIPETLSRILNKMNRLDMIRSDGSKIAILDRPGLEELARGGKMPFGQT